VTRPGGEQPGLAGELETARIRAGVLAAKYAGLLAHVRAAIAAEQAGAPDPLGWLRADLAGQGQLPPAGAVPQQVAADAAAALAMAGWPA
jgi:hypothetical protein